MAQDDNRHNAVNQTEQDVARLDKTLGAFDGELRQVGKSLLYTKKELKSFSNDISGGLRRAFDGVILDGAKLTDALSIVRKSILDSAYKLAMKPIYDSLGSSIASGVNSLVSGLLPFGKGGAFTQGKVMPFARGGVVSSPTSFPMRGGNTGLMGEAGPEAIMPLSRGPDGSLGVKTNGDARPVNVVMNIQTPDVQSFQRSQSQIAARAARAMARGQRNR